MTKIIKKVMRVIAIVIGIVRVREKMSIIESKLNCLYKFRRSILMYLFKTSRMSLIITISIFRALMRARMRSVYRCRR